MQTRRFCPPSPCTKGARPCSPSCSATECNARTVGADPRFGKPNADLGDLIVDSMPHCAAQVRTMIEAYDRYFGDGEGEAFFMGPYLNLLPSAVSKWVRDSVR